MTPPLHDPPPPAPAKPRGAASAPIAQVVLASILVAYFVVGPFVVQVLDVDVDFLLRWTMFNTHANRMCLVEYRAIAPGGGVTRVDRFEWLGIADRDLAPPDVAMIRSPEQALAVGRRLCREQPGTDLRVVVRCPRQGAWQTVIPGEANLCAATSEARGAHR
jgi:hypothetical protein